MSPPFIWGGAFTISSIRRPAMESRRFRLPELGPAPAALDNDGGTALFNSRDLPRMIGWLKSSYIQGGGESSNFRLIHEDSEADIANYKN